MRGRRPDAEAGRLDQARLWRTDDLGGLELLRASYVSFVFTPHAHESFLVALTVLALAQVAVLMPTSAATSRWMRPIRRRP